MTGVPWEQRDTAVAAGFDPQSLTARAARRRTSDAGLGREVVVPVYRLPRGGLLVRLVPGGWVGAHHTVLPADLVLSRGFWGAVRHAADAPDRVRTREGWTQVTTDLGGPAERLVLRDEDWALLRSALALHDRDGAGPQDAPVPRVVARYLGRLDGVDGTPSAGLWGRLALEVVRFRHEGRLADAVSLRWHACWGRGGFGAGSGGRTRGSGDASTLADLEVRRIRVGALPFGVRQLPDWEREEAAHDLGLPARRLMAWPVVPLTHVLADFRDVTPSPLPETPPEPRPQDAPPPPSRGPQDAG